MYRKMNDGNLLEDSDFARFTMWESVQRVALNLSVRATDEEAITALESVSPKCAYAGLFLLGVCLRAGGYAVDWPDRFHETAWDGIEHDVRESVKRSNNGRTYAAVRWGKRPLDESARDSGIDTQNGYQECDFDLRGFGVKEYGSEDATAPTSDQVERLKAATW